MAKSLSWSPRCSTTYETIAPGLGPYEIFIQNKAVGITDLDFELQCMHERQLSYTPKGPPILGQSNAGVVVEVGAAVTRFHKGQRVMAHCHALKTRNPEHAGFQSRTVCLESLATPIPEALTYATAATLPLSISTAAAALYEKTHLNIGLPSQKRLRPRDSLLIIDGTSFVSLAAVQLAVASGVRVIAVAAVRDHDLIQQLGANITIDCKASDVSERMTAALAATRLIGIFDTASTQRSSHMVNDLLRRIGASSRVCCSRPLPPGIAEYQYTVGTWIDNISHFLDDNAGPAYFSDAANIISDVLLAMGISLLRPLHAAVRDEIWGSHIPEALTTGTFIGIPSQKMAGRGLEALPAAVQQIGRCPGSRLGVVVTL